MRKIIHNAAVEMRENPAIAHLPIAVGGSSDRRGVIATCNYEARKFGVRSAMATAHALKLCPNLVLVRGQMALYKEISAQIREIFSRYTDLIEPLSLDEAYLDVSDCQQYQGSATLIAQAIRHDIWQETKLTASAGIAPIKYLAKIASELNKPNGQYVIKPDEIDDFIDDMELDKIPGVGKVSYQKLQQLGLCRGADVKRQNQGYIVDVLGEKFGQVLWQRCHGIDERKIEPSRVRKSVGVEHTFASDLMPNEALNHLLIDKLVPELQRRAEKHLTEKSIAKLGVKVKFADFQQTSKEFAYHEYNQTIFIQLLQDALARGHGKKVRLLGVHIGLNDKAGSAKQLSLAF